MFWANVLYLVYTCIDLDSIIDRETDEWANKPTYPNPRSTEGALRSAI